MRKFLIILFVCGIFIIFSNTSSFAKMNVKENGTLAAELPPIDNGDFGYDLRSYMEYLNLIEGTKGPDYLVGASDPASVDVFIGKGGDDTYIGGEFVSVTGVSVTPTSIDMSIGKTVQLNAEIIPASMDVRWSTSSPDIASVDANGLVTAMSAGTVTVTATTNDGSYAADCVVTVNPRVVTVPVTVTTEDGNFSDRCVVKVTNGNTGGAAEQKYYKNKYPDKAVVILPNENTYGEAIGNTVVVGGNGDDWVEISHGGNTFVYNRNGGRDSVVCVDVKEGNQNEIHFGPGIRKEDLIFVSSDNDLNIIVLGSAGVESGRVTIVDWYLASKNKMSRIVFTDKTALTTRDIERFSENRP